MSYYAASKKTAKGITFLYKMERGIADGSFGLEVAKLAELPSSIIPVTEVLVKLHNKELRNSNCVFTPAQRINSSGHGNPGKAGEML